MPAGFAAGRGTSLGAGLAAVLAAGAEEGGAPGLHDADDRRAPAAGAAVALAAVDQERVGRRPLLDVADVGAAAVGPLGREGPEREVDRGPDAVRQAPHLGDGQRARGPARID